MDATAAATAAATATPTAGVSQTKRAHTADSTESAGSMESEPSVRPTIIVRTFAGIPVCKLGFLTSNSTVRALQGAIASHRLKELLAKQGIEAPPDFVENTSHGTYAWQFAPGYTAAWSFAVKKAQLRYSNDNLDGIMVFTMTEFESAQKWFHDEKLSSLGYDDADPKPFTVFVGYRQDMLDLEEARRVHVCIRPMAMANHSGCSADSQHLQCHNDRVDHLRRGCMDRRVAVQTIRCGNTRVPPRFANDWLVAMYGAVHGGINGISTVSPELRDDRRLILRAVATTAKLKSINHFYPTGAFELASLRLRSCRDTVMAAIKLEPISFKFVCEALHADRSIAAAAVGHDESLIKFASVELRQEFEELGRIRSVDECAADAAAAATAAAVSGS